MNDRKRQRDIEGDSEWERKRGERERDEVTSACPARLGYFQLYTSCLRLQAAPSVFDIFLITKKKIEMTYVCELEIYLRSIGSTLEPHSLTLFVSPSLSDWSEFKCVQFKQRMLSVNALKWVWVSVLLSLCVCVAKHVTNIWLTWLQYTYNTSILMRIINRSLTWNTILFHNIINENGRLLSTCRRF